MRRADVDLVRGMKTETVSGLFVALHRRMEGLEESVARMERKRRREDAQRF